MIRPIFMLIVSACALVMATGCSTTAPSRELASDISVRLESYREDRDRSIANLNASYRASYLALMRRYRTLGKDSLAMERRAAARAAADEMLADWQRRTTLTAILSGLETARAKQLKAIKDRTAAIADARERYAEGYSALELELEKLKTAQAKAAALAEPENSRTATINLISRLADAYQKVQAAERETSKPQ